LNSLFACQILLLLLLSEVMASKHVPLNQTPEYDSHRTNTMTAANTVFNLMTLGTFPKKNLPSTYSKA
jgi:hypothetical protein